MRKDGRTDDQLRPIHFVPAYIHRVPGSVLIEQGETRVVCTATVEEKVPFFLKNSGKGWITAEYSMLPGSCGNQRVTRERLKVDNRSSEIQRFIGRALRTVVDLRAIRERTITLDADVLQADGGTRCASLNGCLLALALCLKYLVFEHLIPDFPKLQLIAAVAVGVKDQSLLVDLNYEEDSRADADINVVSSESGAIVEVEAFAESRPVSADLFRKIIDMAIEKNLEIIHQQKKLFKESGINL